MMKRNPKTKINFVGGPPATPNQNVGNKATDPTSESAAEKPTNLKEALETIETRQMDTPEKLRRLRSDLEKGANAVNKTAGIKLLPGEIGLAKIPCDPVALRPLLLAVKPARFWDHKHRWSSIRSSIAKVLRLTGWVEPTRVASRLHPRWEAALALLSHPSKRAMFKGFGRFCEGNDIAPEAVSNDTLAAYRTFRETHTIDLSAITAVADLRCAWNLLAGTAAGWPTHKLATPKRPRVYVLSSDDMHPNLLVDIESLLARLSKPTPFDRVVGRPRSPIYVALLRTSIKRWVSVLLLAGWSKESLRSLGDMATPKAVKAILLDQYERVGHGDWPPGSATVASNLKLIIKTQSGLTEEQIKPSLELCGAVKAPKITMTSKNRDRLAVYDDPEVLSRFLKLPGLCWKAADKQFAEGRWVTAARLHLFATATAILQCKPLRRSSLALLDIKKHIKYDEDGSPSGFCIDGRETKTGQDAEAIFPPELAKRLKIHLHKYHPRLGNGESTYLFPGKGGAAMHPQTIANGITDLIGDYLGLEFNIHFFRHLVATIILDADAGNGPIAQRMLDHTSLKTTVSKYGIQRTKGAQAQYGQILERKLLKGRKK